MYFTIKKGLYLAGERHNVYSEGGNPVFSTMFRTQAEAIAAVKSLLRAREAGRRKCSYDDCFDLTFHEEDTSKGYEVWTE